MGLSAGISLDTEMGSATAGAFAGMVWNQTFNVLAEANNTTAVPPDQTGYEITAKFNPSMAIIIIVLISAFLFMGFFSIYVRRCTTTEPENANNGQANSRTADSQNRSGQGLDRAVVETLPLVGYSLVKGLKGGKDLSECAVCLSEFEEDERLRLLPKCGHLFHPECIDMWFFSHATCPLCRCSLVPAEGKEGSARPEGFANWVRVDSRGNVSDGLAITIHDGPPAPPNGSILELLSRENAERLLTDSLRRDDVERMDAGLASREENVGEERAGELRALNRALSRNSTSFRKAARGIEVTERIGAASESARFHPSTIAGAGMNGNGGGMGMGAAFFDKRGNNRSVGSSQSFNMALRRSSSVGSSGRYIRQLFGQNYADYFSPETAGDGLRVDRARLLGEHRMPAKEMTATTGGKVRREKSEDELHNMFFNELQNMTYTEDSRRGSSVYRSGELWDSIDLQNESVRAAQQEQSLLSSRTRSGELPPWQRNLDFPSTGKSGELPPLSRNGDKRVRLQGEASGPLYVRRKGNGSTGGDGGTRSDRWNFSIRRTFSLRRTFSDSRDQLDSLSSSQNDSARWYLPGPGIPTPPSRPKKYSSPWAAAMKDRRSQSVDQIASGPSTPTPSLPSPSSAFSPYALSLPSPSVNQASQYSSSLPSPAAASPSTPPNLGSPTVPQSTSSQQDQSQHHQQQAAPESQIQIITQ
ncbi:hypothetical protein Mapa_004916 [Marchantia paleacea]|nr:hypothetical protein Mapa_004916 [Marchantia paleacea]